MNAWGRSFSQFLSNQIRLVILKLSCVEKLALTWISR